MSGYSYSQGSNGLQLFRWDDSGGDPIPISFDQEIYESVLRDERRRNLLVTDPVLVEPEEPEPEDPEEE
jgi:hypothetical protein